MAQLSDEEHALVDELLDCIAEAMARLEEVDPDYASKTKLQKLLYLAIDEFDLPVTYSWYLAGAVIPGDPVTPTRLESAFDELPSTDAPSMASRADETNHTAESASESLEDAITDVATKDLLGAADDDSLDDVDGEPVTSGDGNAATSDQPDEDIDPILFSNVHSVDDGGETAGPSPSLGDRRAAIIDFYEGALPNVWHQNTMRFLQNFYLEHAPPAYRDLYVQSTHFRTRLREVESAVDAHVSGDRPDQPLAEIVDAAGLDISEMHCTLKESDSLAPTFDGFVRGTDLIEDGLMKLVQREPESFEREHVAAVRSMQDFFFYYVWRYPCLIISQETASGPSTSLLRSDRQRRLANFETELEQAAIRFEQELADAALKPDYTDYPAADDEFDESVSELTKHYLR